MKFKAELRDEVWPCGCQIEIKYDKGKLWAFRVVKRAPDCQMTHGVRIVDDGGEQVF